MNVEYCLRNWLSEGLGVNRQGLFVSQAGLELVGSSDPPASAGRSLDRFYHFLAKGPGNMVKTQLSLGVQNWF